MAIYVDSLDFNVLRNASELCGIREIHRVCWLRNGKERGYLEDLDENGSFVYKLILNSLNTKITLN